jgi:hypothetical protein
MTDHTSAGSTSGVDRPKLVTLRPDGDDFVVLFYPEDIVVFRRGGRGTGTGLWSSRIRIAAQAGSKAIPNSET